ncbi:MAG TPA: hypothetical protein VNH18_33450 [Bryobacteraceae bacterium]|nr:hypothetical protein [Bryobacteraceae bacterium]
MISEVPIWAERFAACASVMPPPCAVSVAIRERCEELMSGRVQNLTVFRSDYGFKFMVCVVIDNGCMFDWEGSALAAEWDVDAFADTAWSYLSEAIRRDDATD